MIECNDQQLSDMVSVLSSTAGRRFVYRLIYDVCDIEGGTFHEKVHDGACQSQHQNIREGHRDIGIELQQTFKAHPELALLWCEAKLEAVVQCKGEISQLVPKDTKRKRGDSR